MCKPKLTNTVNRWFFRCTDCLRVVAVDSLPQSPCCGVCAGPMDCMGQVHQDRLITKETRCACDDRCTSATGPICTCKCGGVNHGTHAVVKVIVDHGPIPLLAANDRDNVAVLMARAEAFRAVIAKIEAACKVFGERRMQGEFLPRPEWERWQVLRAAKFDIAKKKSHAGRLKAMTAWENKLFGVAV